MIKINGRLKTKDIKCIEESAKTEIFLDCERVDFFTSKEISTLIYLSSKNSKSFVLLNANEHVKETILILKLEQIFKLE